MKKFIVNVMFIAFVMSFVGFGSTVYAGRGRGSDYSAPGWHHRGGPGYGYMVSGLSSDEMKKMDEQQQTFFDATNELREKMYEQNLGLRSELAKQNPDTQKASELQKELSEIRAQLDQKRVEHMVEMRKLYPNIGTGFMKRGGYGRGMGRGPGNCW